MLIARITNSAVIADSDLIIACHPTPLDAVRSHWYVDQLGIPPGRIISRQLL